MSMEQQQANIHEPEIVIVGAGIAGLATALGLYRLGLRSLVLESSDQLRVQGAAFNTWTNAWRALDALGVGDSLRQQHLRHQGLIVMSSELGVVTAEIPYTSKGESGEIEARCVKRKVLLETLARDLPAGMIRFSSKVVSVEDSGYLKLLHLADGSTIKAKVCTRIYIPLSLKYEINMRLQDSNSRPSVTPSYSDTTLMKPTLLEDRPCGTMSRNYIYLITHHRPHQSTLCQFQYCGTMQGSRN
ncbi:hypothetical protein Dimus_026166 [Dionaea muscipula]